MKYGYARVSSKAQDYAAQVAALKVAGCERIFSEKASGKSTNGRCVGEDGVQAFADFGIENLIELVRMYKENPELLKRWPPEQSNRLAAHAGCLLRGSRRGHSKKQSANNPTHFISS